MSAWQGIKDFFELRPVFTRRLVLACWCIFLLLQAHRIYDGFGITDPSRSPYTTYVLTFGYWFMRYADYYVFRPLNTLLYVVTIRLLIEVGIVLLKYHSPLWPQDDGGLPPRTALHGALNFLTLQPVFTPALLQVFWWTFLLGWLVKIYQNYEIFFLPGGPAYTFHWYYFLVHWSGIFIAIVTTRLLIEVAMIVLHLRATALSP